MIVVKAEEDDREFMQPTMSASCHPHLSMSLSLHYYCIPLIAKYYYYSFLSGFSHCEIASLSVSVLRSDFSHCQIASLSQSVLRPGFSHCQMASLRQSALGSC